MTSQLFIAVSIYSNSTVGIVRIDHSFESFDELDEHIASMNKHGWTVYGYTVKNYNSKGPWAK